MLIFLLKRIVDKHPSFVQAATLIASIVSEEGEKTDGEHTATGHKTSIKLTLSPIQTAFV